MVLPALRRVFDRFPAAQVDVLTSPDGVRVLKGFHPRLGALMVQRKSGIRARVRLRRLVTNGDYDHIFCFETHPRFQKLSGMTRAQVTLLPAALDRPMHYAQRCLLAVDPAGGSEPQVPYLGIQDRGATEAAALLAESGIGDETLLVGLHPTCSSSRKRFWRGRGTRHNKEWPAEHFAALADRLFAYAGERGVDLRVLMDLLPDEREYGERIVAASGGRVLLQTPPPDFERYKAVLRRMDVLVTPDTGPMHLAAALGTPLVALFAGKNPADCGPFAPAEQYRVLRAEDMPGAEQGIRAIPPEAVFAACRVLLDGAAEAGRRRAAAR